MKNKKDKTLFETCKEAEAIRKQELDKISYEKGLQDGSGEVLDVLYRQAEKGKIAYDLFVKYPRASESAGLSSSRYMAGLKKGLTDAGAGPVKITLQSGRADGFWLTINWS